MNYLKYIFYIVEDSELNKKLIEKYPELEADLVSAKDNPTCSCRGRVWEFFVNKFSENEKESNNFFKELVDQSELVKLRIETEEKNHSFMSTIHEIDDNQISWNLFQEKLNQVPYRSVNILKTEIETIAGKQNKLRIYIS